MKNRVLSIVLIVAMLTIGVIGSCGTLAASYTQRVELKSFQPQVKTLLVDDNFDDYNDDGSRTITSPYNHGYTNCKTIADDSNGGKALNLQNNSQYIQFTRVLDSNKLVISFDTYTNPDLKAGFSLFNRSNKLVDFNAWSTSNNGSISVFGTKVASASAGAFKTGKWVNFSMELERVEKSDGTGYDVKVNNIYYDNERLSYSTEPPVASNIDWWTSGGGANIQFKTQDARLFDNIIIYEPKIEGEIDTPEKPPLPSADTHVKIDPDYMPPVGKIIMDEDFQDSTVDSQNRINSEYDYSMANYQFAGDGETSGLFTDEDTANKYLKNSSKYYIYSKQKGPINSDKLVISMEVTPYQSLTYRMSFSKGATMSLLYIFGTVSGDDSTKSFRVGSSISNALVSSVKIKNTDTARVVLVLKKVMTDDGYKAVLSEAYLNDIPMEFKSYTPTTYLPDNWWDCPEEDSTITFSNFNVAGDDIDNILVYAPSTPDTDPVDPIAVTEEPSSSNDYSLTLNNAVGTSGRVYVDGDGESRREIKYTYENENKTIKPVEFAKPGIGYKLYFEGFKDYSGSSLGKVSYSIGDSDIIAGDIALLKDEKPYSMMTTDSGEVTTKVKVAKKNEATGDPTVYTAIYDNGRLVSVSSASTYADGMATNTVVVPDNLSANAYMTVFAWSNTFKPYMKSKKMEFIALKEKATLHLVGDSIGVTYNTSTAEENPTSGRFPQQGMGNYLEGIFKPGTITVKNYSVGGSTTLDYLNNTYNPSEYWKSNCWSYVMSNITPGDYVLIVLGINDKAKLGEEEFKANLAKMVKDVKNAGANAIIGSSTFTGWGVTDKSFKPSSNNYYEFAIQAAADNNVPCIDLHTAMQDDLKALCADSSKTYMDALNEYYLTADLFATEDPAGTKYYKNSSVLKNGYDVTHLSYKGAKRLCEVIIKDLLEQSSSSLKAYLK